MDPVDESPVSCCVSPRNSGLIAFFSGGSQNTFFPTVFGFSLVALIYGLLVFSAISPRSLLFRIRSRWTANLATLSYSLYLSHKGVIHLTQRLLQGTMIREDGNLMLLICLTVCIAGALLMRIVIEKPFFALRDKLLVRDR
jgi:peptidoglycan/LPS O-acetylase OafA/YrhL